MVSAVVSAVVAGRGSGPRAGLSGRPGFGRGPRIWLPEESPGGDSAGPEAWQARLAGQRD